MTQRLPIPGSDDGDWGDILNAFLGVSHNSDGTLSSNAVGDAGAALTTNNLSDLQSPAVARTNLGLGSASTLSSTVNGDLSGTLPSPIVARINGITLPSSAPSASGQVLTTDGSGSNTSTSWITPAAGVTLDSTASDIQPLGSQSAGSSSMAAKADHVHAMPRLDQVSNPTTSVNLNSEKITNLANGSLGTDAAAYGQIPVAGTTSGTYAAGNDSRITGALQTSNNLSELSSTAAIARTNLGLGTASTANIDTTASDIQINGTQGAGSTGKVADAGHVHPMPTLNQISAPTTSVAMNSQKLTNLANGSTTTDSAAYGQIMGWAPSLLIATSGTINVPATPSTPIHAKITCVGGGGGGGGGGSASSNINQVGGGAGGAGGYVQPLVALGSNTSLTYNVGAGGTAGSGGAAGGNAGTGGNNGSTTSVTGTGISVSAAGGISGNASTASSTSAAQGGAWGLSQSTVYRQSSAPMPGGGGWSAYNGWPGIGPVGGGGGGGGAATTTNGGGGGTAGVLAATGGSGAGASGASGTTTGVVGGSAAANSGAGGAGGGGGAYNSGSGSGAGGNGGAGGSGYIIIEWLP